MTLTNSWLCLAVLLCITPAVAQSVTEHCPVSIVPLSGEQPPANIVVDPPLAEPLAARSVAVIQYCAKNLHIAPVFGQAAAGVSPRIGHLHVTVDDSPWHWADASGNPIILQGLSPGPHKVLIELANANHHVIDKATVTFVVPEKNADAQHKQWLLALSS